jgi:hypothetical protein
VEEVDCECSIVQTEQFNGKLGTLCMESKIMA